MSRTGILFTVAFLFAAAQFASGQPRSTDRMLDKKIDHYREKGYTVIKAGDFPSGNLTNTTNYVVVSVPYRDMLKIPVSRTVILESGTRLFIEPSVSIQIDGRLEAEYTGLNGVPPSDLYLGQMITNKNWRGIQVGASGSLRLSGVTISDVDSAVVCSAPRDSINLTCIKITGKTACAVTIGEVCEATPDLSCVSVSKRLVVKEDPVFVPDAEKKNGREREKNRGAWKIPVRIVFGAVGVAGVVALAVGQSQIVILKNNYETAANQQLLEKYRTDYYSMKTIRDIGIAAGITGLCGITVTFLF